MNVKLIPASIVFLFVFCFSCKKSTTTSTSTSHPTASYIDGMKGYYAGITTGDSVYYYTDGSGKVQHAVRSFSWADSIVITAADTASITVTSARYNITFPYYYYLTTTDTVSYLQTNTVGQGGYVPFNATFVDTANGINHIALNVSYGYSKNFTSNFALYKRQ